jgi:hypothetical protein
MDTTITNRLFWAESGEVTCEQHAPFKGSDTWVHGRWSEMTTTDRLEWVKFGGTPAKCEVCK